MDLHCAIANCARATTDITRISAAIIPSLYGSFWDTPLSGTIEHRYYFRRGPKSRGHIDIQVRAKALTIECVRGAEKPSSIYVGTRQFGGIDDTVQSKLTFIPA